MSEATDILFRQACEQAVAFRRTLGARPQHPERSCRELLACIEQSFPATGCSAQEVLEELSTWASPGLHTTAGPRFFAWVAGASHPLSVAADFMTSAWGQNAGNHVASPAAAAAESLCASWLLDLLDLPRTASVGFVTGATMANFTGLAAARGHVLRRVGWDVEAEGLFGAPPISVLVGEDAHTSILAALRMLGLGQDRVHRIATDAEGAMLPFAFAHTARSLDGPMIVACQAGQLNSGAFDPFPQILEIARDKQAWVHVDGAFGLWARACPTRNELTEGLELADSWSTDAHKWLQVPFESGIVIVRHAEAHQRAMATTASYLPPCEDKERDPSHFVPELSRRARGFALWAMLRHLGRDGIATMVERHCRFSQQMAMALSDEPGIAILNRVVLNQVIVRFGADREPVTGDRLTDLTIARIVSQGICYVGGAEWHGRRVMRLSVISCATEEQDVKLSTNAILSAWRSVREDAAENGAVADPPPEPEAKMRSYDPEEVNI